AEASDAMSETRKARLATKMGWKGSVLESNSTPARGAPPLPRLSPGRGGSHWGSAAYATNSLRLFGLPIIAHDLGFREEVGDLGAGRLGGIRAVDGVRVDALGEVRSDGARGGFLGVGRSHDLSVLGDGVL